MAFWVKIHGLLAGFCTSKIVQDIGNYVGFFLHSDPQNFLGSWRYLLQIRVDIDVHQPLKRSLKIKQIGG